MSFVENALKSHLGIKKLKDYQQIDERVWSYNFTTISEISFEEHEGNKYARFRFITFKGSGTTGRERKIFPWPVSNIENPIELKQITETILSATRPEVEFHDHCGGFGRLFDNLFGLRLINSIEEIASHEHFGKKHWLKARIYKEKKGVVVTLIHDVHKGQAIWVRLPIETIEAIHEWLIKQES